MELFNLFFTFFKIGATSFGGGYAMISIIRDAVLHQGWLTDLELLNFIAVSESTPGPISINLATFIGSSRSGIIGSILATLGVVLPSFTIILIIVKYISNLLKNKIINSFLDGIKPCIIGLILSTSITMFLSTILSLSSIKDNINIDIIGIGIFTSLIIIHLIIKKVFKKEPSPIIMILFSAILGIIFYR